MGERFDPAARSVFVRVRVVGPLESHDFRCAIDTGSTRTMLPAGVLRRLGYDLSRPVEWTRVRAATGVARVPVVRVSAVAAHDLPYGTTADGLLGLVFSRARPHPRLRPRPPLPSRARVVVAVLALTPPAHPAAGSSSGMGNSGAIGTENPGSTAPPSRVSASVSSRGAVPTAVYAYNWRRRG